MWFYLALFISSTFLIYLGSRSGTRCRRVLYLIGIGLPALVAAFRGIDVGTDTLNYVDRYGTLVNATGMRAMLTAMDTELFFIFACFIGKFFGGYEFVFFSYEFLSLLFIILTLDKFRHRVSVWLGYVLFLFFFYNASLNIMRQILALPYIVYASTFLLEGNKKKFLYLIAFSITLHLTAIVASGIVYVMYRFTKVHGLNKSQMYSLYAFGLIIAFFMVDFVMSYMVAINFGASYAYTSTAGNSVIGATDILYSLVLIYVSHRMMNRHLISAISPDFFYLASLSCLMLFLTGYYNQWLARMAYYMLAFACLYLPMLVKSKKVARYRQVYSLGIFMFGFVYWMYLIVISGSNATIPYQTMNGLQFSF